MRYTGSISRGKTAEKHNTRECYRHHAPENIDQARSANNVVLANRSLAEVYRERFGAAQEAYNARQVERGHPERQVRDYLDKVRSDKQLQPMYEFVVQVGNRDEHPDAELAEACYRDWLERFQARYGGHFAVKQAIIHMDEATPHMHVELVPVAESKRGLSVQNSMNKAVKQAGFDDYKAMLAGWDEVLGEVMASHGIERIAGDRERQAGGVDIDTYRRTMRAREELAAGERRLEEVRRREREERERAGELERAIEQARLEPARESLSESLRALSKGRGAGEREEGLRGELEGLRERYRASERERGRVEERIRELERRNGAARSRNRELRERAGGLRGRLGRVRARLGDFGQAVERAMRELGRVPVTLSRSALARAWSMGITVYDVSTRRGRGHERDDRGISR